MCIFYGYGASTLKDIIPIIRSVVVQESHVQPWPQICGLICSLNPKVLQRTLEGFWKKFLK